MSVTRRRAPGAVDGPGLHEVTIVPRPLEQLARVLSPDRAERLAATAARARAASATGSSGTSAPPRPGAAWPRCSRPCWPTATVPGSTTGGWSSRPTPSSSRSPSACTTCCTETRGRRPPRRRRARPLYGGARREPHAPAPRVSPGDIVLLHDPQTAGLVGGLRAAGAHVVWRCHIGRDEPNELAEAAWDFLRPYLAAAEAFVFSRASTRPPGSTRRGSTSSHRPSIRSRPRTATRPGRRWRRSWPRRAGRRRRPDGPVRRSSAGTDVRLGSRRTRDGGLIVDGPPPPRTLASSSRSAGGTGSRTWPGSCAASPRVQRDPPATPT